MNTRTRALRAPASRLVAACSAGGRLPRPPRAVARRNAAAAGRALAARGGPAGPGAARASSRPSARGVGTLAGRAAGAPRSSSGRRRDMMGDTVTANRIAPTVFFETDVTRRVNFDVQAGVGDASGALGLLRWRHGSELPPRAEGGHPACAHLRR